MVAPASDWFFGPIEKKSNMAALAIRQKGGKCTQVHDMWPFEPLVTEWSEKYKTIVYVSSGIWTHARHGIRKRIQRTKPLGHLTDMLKRNQNFYSTIAYD